MPDALPFHVLGSAVPMPASERTVYVDGSAGRSFRHEVDLELSHWVPTSTPARWSADTSTEICLRFLDDPPPDVQGYDLAINNHVDVDGILAVFVLAHPDIALAHRDVLVGAAEVGDLSAWAVWPSFRLAQELTLAMGGFGASGRDPRDTYVAAFALVLSVLADGHEAPRSVVDGWAHLELDGARLADGTVAVACVGERFTSFVLPDLDDDDRAAALRIAPFNAVVDGSIWLWPHARNRHHGQAAHLVSVPRPGGWSHDLWLPGYVWAHTPDRWRPPVLEDMGDSNTWRIRPQPLGAAVAALQADEHGAGTWALATQVDPFTAAPGRAFPVIASFLGPDREPGASSHPPAAVAEVIAPSFAAS